MPVPFQQNKKIQHPVRGKNGVNMIKKLDCTKISRGKILVTQKLKYFG